jgi:hypothetical protein
MSGPCGVHVPAWWREWDALPALYDEALMSDDPKRQALQLQLCQEVMAQWLKGELTSEQAMVTYSLVLMPGKLSMVEVAREVRLHIAHLGD